MVTHTFDAEAGPPLSGEPVLELQGVGLRYGRETEVRARAKVRS